MRVPRLRGSVHLRDEVGVTLVELMVSLVVTSMVAAIFLGTMTSLNQTVSEEQERSDNNSEARAALEQMDREVRSAAELYDPAQESPPHYSVRIYTQSNAPTRGAMCVQWLIRDRNLLRRQWAPSQEAPEWRVVAEDVVNIDLGVPAFRVDPDDSKGGRTLQVTFLVNNHLSQRPQQTVRLQTSLTGRNLSFGTPATSCTVSEEGDGGDAD